MKTSKELIPWVLELTRRALIGLCRRVLQARIILAIVVAGLSGCKLIVGPDDAPPRFVMAESIEDVRPGDDSLSAVEKLGHPTEVIEGDFPAMILRYDEGPRAGLEVEVLSDSELGEGVLSLCVYAPYSGRSGEGIGIGSEMANVINAYGEPHGTHSFAAAGAFHWYNGEAATFQMEYDGSDRLRSICMIPLEDMVGEGIRRHLVRLDGHLQQVVGLEPLFVFVPRFRDHFWLLLNGCCVPEGNLPAEFHEDGLAVRLSGWQVDIPPGVRQVGVPFRLSSIVEMQ